MARTPDASELLGLLTQSQAEAERLQSRVAELEGELARMGELACSILGTATEAIYGVDAEERFTFLNTVAERFFGYSAGELIGQRAHALIHHTLPTGEPYPPEECPLLRTLHDGVSRRGKGEVFIRKDGALITADYVANALREGERTVGAVLALRETTTQRTLREALLESQERSRLLAEYTADVLMRVTLDGVYLYVSPAARRVLGYDPVEMVGRSFGDFVHPEDLPQLLALRERSVRTPFTPHSVVLRHRHGREAWRWVEATGQVILDPATGLPQEAVLAVRDVTDRVQLKAALRAANEDLERRVAERTTALERADTEIRDLYDNAPCGYHSVDAGGVLIRVNATELTWLGYAREEVEGRMHAKALLMPESQAIFEETFAHFKETGRIDNLELRMRRKDGSPLEVLLTASAMRDAAGRFVMSRSMIFDNTERKRAEQALREVEQARELDRLRRAFVNAVSHELRTPITSVLGYTEFLDEELGGPLTLEQRGFVEQIMRSSRQLERLVNDLLDFARIEAGTFRLQLAPGDLAQAVREVAESLRPQAREAGVELALALPEAPLSAAMDLQRVEQVLMNLATNALKFSPRGGVVRLRACASDGRVRCEVEDAGVGISREEVPKLFQRFSQLEAGKALGGTGLGLAISKSVIEAHGGTIGVESHPGERTVFWFELPAATA